MWEIDHSDTLRALALGRRYKRVMYIVFVMFFLVALSHDLTLLSFILNLAVLMLTQIFIDLEMNKRTS